MYFIYLFIYRQLTTRTLILHTDLYSVNKQTTNELERISTEVVVGYLFILSRHQNEGNGANHEIPQNILYLGRYFNTGPPE